MYCQNSNTGLSRDRHKFNHDVESKDSIDWWASHFKDSAADLYVQSKDSIFAGSLHIFKDLAADLGPLNALIAARGSGDSLRLFLATWGDPLTFLTGVAGALAASPSASLVESTIAEIVVSMVVSAKANDREIQMKISYIFGRTLVPFVVFSGFFRRVDGCLCESM